MLDRGVDDVVCVLLVPPSRDVQEQRLRAQGRLRGARRAGGSSSASASSSSAGEIADAVVVNDDLDRAADELAAIVESGRQRGSQ